jgi:hypothetical protein
VTTEEAVPVRVRPSGGLTEAEIVSLTAIHAGTGAVSATLDEGSSTELAAFADAASAKEQRS